jgi:HSP20 family molecular chaperone IbpA
MNELRNQDSAPSVAQKSQRGQTRYSEQALMPPVDVLEDADAITLYADLPGVSRDKLHLQVEAGALTIDAELDLTLPEGLESSHTEVGLGRFHRSFTLSQELDPEKVSAELSNGVLRLRIPKAEHAKPRRISVSAA